MDFKNYSINRLVYIPCSLVVPRYTLSFGAPHRLASGLAGLVITGCHLCVGSTPIINNAKGLFWYEHG